MARVASTILLACITAFETKEEVGSKNVSEAEDFGELDEAIDADGGVDAEDGIDTDLDNGVEIDIDAETDTDSEAGSWLDGCFVEEVSVEPNSLAGEDSNLE